MVASGKTSIEPLVSGCPPRPQELPRRGSLSKKDTYSSWRPLAKLMAHAGTTKPHRSMSTGACSEQLITDTRAGEVRA